MFKAIVLDVLEFLRRKVLADECTPQELADIARVVAENVEMNATIGDIARHYGQSESNVRNVIARRYVGKPKRRVMYDFGEFARHVPSGWRKSRQRVEE